MPTPLNPLLGHKIVIKLGNGASPEVFAPMTVINASSGLSFSTESIADDIVDLDDLGLPAQKFRRVASIDSSVTGEGKVHKGTTKALLDWWKSGAAKNLVIVSADVADDWQIDGPFVLSKLDIKGERNQMAEISITLEQAAPITVDTAS